MRGKGRSVQSLTYFHNGCVMLRYDGYVILGYDGCVMLRHDGYRMSVAVRRGLFQLGMMSVTASCNIPMLRGKWRGRRRPSRSTAAFCALSTWTCWVR